MGEKDAKVKGNFIGTHTQTQTIVTMQKWEVASENKSFRKENWNKQLKAIRRWARSDKGSGQDAIGKQVKWNQSDFNSIWIYMKWLGSVKE